METTNKMNKKILISLALIIVFLVFLSNIPHKHSLADIKYVQIAGVSVKVDLALTPGEQEQGLSGRAGLDDNTGMLFVFNKPDKYLFWMKDMNFSIDMIWIDSKMKVIYIKKDAKPESFPESYGPDAPALYVLEVPDNFSDNNNLQVGDSAGFIY